MKNQPHGQVLVTGAIGGLGTAMVQRLLGEGYAVISCDRQADRAGDWLQRLPADQRDRVSFYALDVTKEDQVNALADALRAKGVHVAYLVNNAGIHGAGTESRVWERTLRVNLYGTFYLTRALSQAMKERRFGRIVNLASLSAYHPLGEQGPYAAAKAAITGYTRSTALDLAPYGVTVNAIAPGLILHEGLRVVFSDQALEATARRVPVGRAGKPEEIAATVSFLFSDDAAYITGQTIHVNGGMYLPG
ncbi:MAG: SDR family oxidoreductase [Deltaproteobacteria bacterium]|nr:MAG: SDR family oxidoreductase [Deltaproteobacteria bacterium]